MAAGIAQRQRGIAPAVEEQQALLPRRQPLLDGLDQRRRQPCAALGPVFAQINHRHRWHGRPAVAAGQDQALVAAFVGIEHGFQRGRGAGQHDGTAGDVGPDHGHVPRLIDHAVFLLEAAVVLLVEDDHLQLTEGQEQRRTRANDDPGLALGHRAPGLGALLAGQIRVPQRRGAAEALLEAAEPLPGQRNLRQHDQNLPRVGRVGEQTVEHVEVNLGLTRAGNPVDQGDAEALRVVGDQPVGGFLLPLAQLEGVTAQLWHWPAPTGATLEGFNEAEFDQAVDYCG